MQVLCWSWDIFTREASELLVAWPEFGKCAVMRRNNILNFPYSLDIPQDNA